MSYLWYRNVFWWVIIATFSVFIYVAADKWLGWDIKWICGYAFAQIYYQYVKKEE